MIFDRIREMAKDIFKPKLAAVLTAGVMIMGCVPAFAIESEYDYDFQIDVSAFSNAELGTISSDTPSGTTADITLNGNQLYINGHEKYLDSPMLYANDTLMLALTSMQNFMECKVYYDPALYTAYIIKGEYSIRIALGSNLAIINNAYTEYWDAPLINYDGHAVCSPQILNGFTVVYN